jgi:hypothetical protein
MELASNGFFLCEGYTDPSTGNFVRFHGDACISIHSEPNPTPPSLLETLDSDLSIADLLTLTKGMVQDLATDDLSRETLIWTAQPKLDAHYKRIHDILNLLHTTPPVATPHAELEKKILLLQEENRRMRESHEVEIWRVQEGLPRFYSPETESRIHPFDAELKRQALAAEIIPIIYPVPAPPS